MNITNLNLKHILLLDVDREKKCCVKKCMSKAFAFLSDIKRAFGGLVVAICNTK